MSKNTQNKDRFRLSIPPDIDIEDSSSNRSSKDNTSTSSKPASQSTRSASQTSSSSQISNVSSPNKSSKYGRSEEHTSELQSQSNLVCRLLLEKKNNNR